MPHKLYSQEDLRVSTSPGWHKLNKDGSFQKENQAAGIGCVIRDENGDWKIGRMAKVLCDCADEAEAWGLLKGLRMAWETGIQKLIIETDSLTIFNWINNT